MDIPLKIKEFYEKANGVVPAFISNPQESENFKWRFVYACIELEKVEAIKSAEDRKAIENGK